MCVDMFSEPIDNKFGTAQALTLCYGLRFLVCLALVSISTSDYLKQKVYSDVQVLVNPEHLDPTCFFTNNIHVQQLDKSW